MKGFKELILRGNVIDLAVAVVIGAAFTAIVNAIVNGVFNPAIGALFNAENLDNALNVEIPTTEGGAPAVIQFGLVIAAVIQFLLVAAVVYFALIVPINTLQRVAFARRKAEAETESPKDTPPTELELLAQIRDLLARQEEKPTA